MASKMTKDAVEKLMPRMEVLESQAGPSGVDAKSSSTKPGPSMIDLKRKFLGAAADDSDVAADSSGVDDAKPDEAVEVVRVRPKRAPADPVDDPGPRTVIVSKTGGFIGSQG